MKRSFILVLVLALLSCASGYLMSKASWVGRVGMTFFYKEYNFMKIWWQGAIAIFIALMVLFAVHSFLQRRLPIVAARLLNTIILILVIAGLYLTYDDFSNDFAHRMLGRRFHYGVYLFWVGWLFVCVFFIFKKKRTVTIVTRTDKTELTNQ